MQARLASSGRDRGGRGDQPVLSSAFLSFDAGRGCSRLTTADVDADGNVDAIVSNDAYNVVLARPGRGAGGNAR